MRCSNILVCFLGLFFNNLKAAFSSRVIQLTDGTWDEMLTGEWMVKFYAPWCPACRSAESPWNDFAKTWADELGISVGDLDITTSPGASGRFLITSLPTILHVKDGAMRYYKNARTSENLVKFVQDREWEKLEPVPWYKHPSTPHMACLGYAFRLSLHIRNLHDYITETLGYPVWASYLAFAVGIIFSAIALGLIFVLILDKCCPAGPALPSPPLEETEDLEDDTKKEEVSADGTGDVRRRKPAPVTE